MCAKTKGKNQHIYFIFNVILFTRLTNSNINIRSEVPKSHSHPISLHTQLLPGPWILPICIYINTASLKQSLHLA